MEEVRSEMDLSWKRKRPSQFQIIDPGVSKECRQNRERGGYQNVRLADLVGRLLQASLGGVDAAVAVVDVLLQVAQVVVLEAVLLALVLGQGLVLVLERLGVHLGAGAQVLLGVGEEVVRAGADEVGAAHLGVGQGELGAAGGGPAAHELLCRGGRGLVSTRKTAPKDRGIGGRKRVDSPSSFLCSAAIVVGARYA
ncbi:hypothetical protein VTK73DRAFT_3089 [Phialemonium thermophilum]|uniref:Uncharacterized protein n=1 Tax=Phialemonium thermophilum TaxID=223376 RepID=A0ABR3VKX3_9PEZI